MHIDNFKEWLQPRYKARENKMITAYCTVCNSFMNNLKQQLERHCETPKQNNALEKVVKSAKQKKLIEGFTGFEES